MKDLQVWLQELQEEYLGTFLQFEFGIGQIAKDDYICTITVDGENVAYTSTITNIKEEVNARFSQNRLGFYEFMTEMERKNYKNFYQELNNFNNSI